MKKKIILISSVLLLIIVAIIIPKERYLDWFEKPNDAPTHYDNYQFVYVLNSQKELVGIDVGLTQKPEDEVVAKWNLLTSNTNALPSGYSSPIYQTTELLSYEINDKIISLNLSDDFLYSEGRVSLECIAFNFCNDTVEEVELLLNGDLLTSFDNLQFETISKRIGANLIYETSKLLLADSITIMYYYEDYLKPVTYFYLDSEINEVTYLVKKALMMTSQVSESNINSLISYELKEDTLDIHIESYETIEDEVIQTIKASIALNFPITTITINGTNITNPSVIEPE